MGKNNISSALKKLRIDSGLSVNDVILRLRYYNQDISGKTLYSYESGKRATSADMLLSLCQIYDCSNILETFASAEVDYSIPTNEEMKLLEKYRDLDNHGKEIVDMVLDIEHKRWVSECKKATSLESNVTDFKKEDSEHLKLNAVHALPNATEGEKQYDDVMNDEKF